jgi:anhydro-N-acetylmuramic acid kinase
LKAKDLNNLQLIGLMSGTSLDGLDIAHVKFQFSSSQNIDFEIINAETIAYPHALLERLKLSTELKASDLFQLHHDLGLHYADCLKAFSLKIGVNLAEIDAVASHGQTIFHRPDLGYTVQIGCGVTLNYHTGVPVINDFRTLDVVAGGQGAPLVPLGDAFLFANKADGFLNLGGFANISTQLNSIHQAFDIAPANLPLNYWMQEIGKNYDEDGQLSRSGEVNSAILEQLLRLPYFVQKGPKSLGTEWLNEQYMPLFAGLELKDKLRTHTELLSVVSGDIFKTLQLNQVLVTGGGAFNSFLLERLQANYDGKLILPEKNIIEFKEALIFAFLGARFIRKETTTIASVTGAQQALCTGTLHDYQGKLDR